MRRSIAMALALVVGFGSVSAVFAQDKKSPEEQFKKLDKDGDSKLTLEEFVGKKKDEAKTKAEEIFKKKDKDSDGKLTLEEFKGKAKA